MRIIEIEKIIELIKLILSSGVFIAAIVGVSKYIYEKNRDIYIKRLNEVYAPLFSYLIKQETIRKLYVKQSVKEAPILTVTRKKEQTKMSLTGNLVEKTEEKTLLLDRNNFIKILNEVNMGLINPRLLKLLNAYEILIYLEETLGNGSDEWQIATTKKVEVEYELFKEVQIGYEETIKKLKLDDEFEIDNLENFTL